MFVGVYACDVIIVSIVCTFLWHHAVLPCDLTVGASLWEAAQDSSLRQKSISSSSQ